MPVLATKLHAPVQRGRLVPRARLLEGMTALLEPGQRMALVSAPAGFGKTTLVSTWIAHVAEDPDELLSLAWVSLDDADNELGRLMAHVLTALRDAGAPIDTGRLDAMTSESLDLAAATALLTTVMNQVSSTTSDPGEAGDTEGNPRHSVRRWLLVVDDYHLITEPDVHTAVTYLLDHLPEQLRLAVITRSDPPLPLARLRSRGQLVELRAADLRFTHEEADAFLNQVMGLELDTGDVAALDDRTEGWAAGLQLAALSLRGRTGAQDISDFIGAFTGSNRFVVDYLVDEVLTRQPEEVRSFLLRTSVLDRLTGALCDAVIGASNSHELLARLERDNLFVVPLDDDRTWYRYHHLFAEALRTRLIAGTPDAVADLHRAASDWYAAHDHLEAAVNHAFAGNDFDRAGRLVETGLSQMRRQRRDARLLAWLRALPDEVVRPNPVLSTAVSWAAMVAGDLEGMESRLDDADRALASAEDDPKVAAGWVKTEDLRSAPASIHIYRAALAQARGDSDGTADHARAALSLVGPDDHFVRGAGAGFLGLAAWAKGDVEEALPTFEQSVAALRAAGNHVDALDSTVVLAGMWVTAGRPSRARALCEQALRTATGGGEPYPRATADLHTWLAALALARNDLTGAEDQLATAATLAERASITENQHRWPTVMAGVRAAQGDYAGALGLLDDAAQRYRAGFYPDLQPLPAAAARVHLAAGDLDAALRWVTGTGVDLGDQPEFAREYEHLTLVRAHLSMHRMAGAPTLPPMGAQPRPDLAGVLELLERLEASAVADGRHGSVIEVRLLQSLAQHALDDISTAVATLARAVQETPEVENYTRLFLDEDPAVTALLDADALSSATPQLEAIAAWWHQFEAHDHETATLPGVQASQSLTGGLPDPLSEREAEVLRLLASELTGPEIARSLYVTVNTLRTHTKRIFAKLDVSSRAAAVRRARQLGLL